MSRLFRVRRSYTLRERGLKQQQQTIAEKGVNIIIPYQERPVDWLKVFDIRQAPGLISVEEDKTDWNSAIQPDVSPARLVLEIGFGKGEVLIDEAIKKPRDLFIGVDVYSSGVSTVLREVEAQDIKNICLIQADAVDVVPDMFADNILDEVKILFPDPWPKKRHHKRRMLRSDFINVLVKKMKVDGILHVATDWDEYAEEILEVLERCPKLKNLFPGYAAGRQLDRIVTNFEQKAINSSRNIYEMLFKKI